MKLRTIGALLGASALGLAATTASAAVTFVGYQTALNPGEQLLTAFEGGPTLGGVTLNLTGFTLDGSAGLFTGSTPRVSAAPAFDAATRDTTQYLGVQRGQSATLETPALRAISFYVGSLDRYNSFTFRLADGTSQTFTGNVLGALPGAAANGNQTAFTTNGRLTFSFDSAITGVDIASASDSLEISDIGVVGLVPEPQAWALMIVGFAGAGALLRRRRAAIAA